MSEPAVLPAAEDALAAGAVQLRPIEPDDRDAAARIVYEAFAGIHDHHRFSRDFPTLEAAADLVCSFVSHPLIWGVVAPFAAIRDGRLVAYATTLSFFPAAYAVAESQEDMTALIAGALAGSDAPASFLLPTRQHELLRWCLQAGLRIVKPMTYMIIGEHRRPRGAWIPSVLY